MFFSSLFKQSKPIPRQIVKSEAVNELNSILNNIRNEVFQKKIKDKSILNHINVVRMTYIENLPIEKIKLRYPNTKTDTIYQWRTRGLRRVEKNASDNLKDWIKSIKYRKTK